MADKSRGVSFDADALAAANEEPTLTLAGYVYHGRLLSAPEWFLWRDRALALYARATSAPATVPEAEELALYQAFFKDVFPRRRFRFWAPDPVPVLMAQPLGLVREAYQRFFLLQARANGVTGPQPLTPPSPRPIDVGPSSSAPTLPVATATA